MKMSEWGLTATSKDRSISIQIDESINDDKYCITLSSQNWHLTVNLINIQRIAEFETFIRTTKDKNEYAEFKFGVFENMDVSIVRDDELKSFWIKLHGNDGLIEMTIDKKGIDDLLKSIEEVVDDLNSKNQ
ncbi:MAG: hypothetical protein GY865_19840 [candidate division Zixibacteria bacterium]|nr:hypothetical protein [candidate division Zixibacteria bacterium]